MDTGTFLEALGLCVLIVLLAVVGRLLWCMVVGWRERRYGILAISAVGSVVMLAVFAVLIVVWFGYGVAHIGKSARNDFILFFSTVPPYFLMSLGLWLLGGKLVLRLNARR